MLTQNDGKPLNLGEFRNAVRRLLITQIQTNGHALMMAYNYKDKIWFFDIQSGKLILKEKISKNEEYVNQFFLFNSYKGNFYGITILSNSEEDNFRVRNFTIPGFGKPNFDSGKTGDNLNARLITFQKEIFAKKEEANKSENVASSELNLIERLMFNVQTSDLIEESKMP